MKTSIRAPAIAVLTIAMIAAGPARAQQLGELQNAPAEAQSPAETASDADLEGARGGWVWVVIGAGATGSLFVVRQCASRIGACASGARAVFTSSRQARQWVCRRTGRLC